MPDVAWSKRPENRDRYYAEVADDVRRMKGEGFEVFIITCLNMRERKPGEPEGFDDILFDPTDKALLHSRSVGVILHRPGREIRIDFGGDSL